MTFVLIVALFVGVPAAVLYFMITIKTMIYVEEWLSYKIRTFFKNLW